MKERNMLTAEQAELCLFAVQNLYLDAKRHLFGTGNRAGKASFHVSSGMWTRTSSTLQDRILHKSFRVAVEILRFCLRESSVPRLNEYFVMSA